MFKVLSHLQVKPFHQWSHFTVKLFFLTNRQFFILNSKVDITVRNISEELFSVQSPFIGQGVWHHGYSIWVGDAGQAILQVCHRSVNTVCQTLHQINSLEKL